ncbi:MAG: hypothetical protein U0840_12435 [Gemmataceae bacterium]
MSGDIAKLCLVYGLLILIGITGALGDIWVYAWFRTGQLLWLILASTACLASLFLFGLLLWWDIRTFSAVFILSSVLHSVAVLWCDWAYFGGRPNRLEWFGIILSFVVVLLLELGRDSSLGEDAQGKTVSRLSIFSGSESPESRPGEISMRDPGNGSE